jgi:hypothetical protein
MSYVLHGEAYDSMVLTATDTNHCKNWTLYHHHYHYYYYYYNITLFFAVFMLGCVKHTTWLREYIPYCTTFVLYGHCIMLYRWHALVCFLRPPSGVTTWCGSNLVLPWQLRAAHMSFPSIPLSLSVYLSFLFTWNSVNFWALKPSWVDYKILSCHRIGNCVFAATVSDQVSCGE